MSDQYQQQRLMCAGMVSIMPLPSLLLRSTSPTSLPSPDMLNTGSSLEERFLVYDVRASAEQKAVGFMALLRPTTEKSVISFYSCGTISFFLKPYYFYAIKLPYKQPCSCARLRCCSQAPGSAIQALSAGV